MANMYKIAGPLLRALPPETAHGLTLWLLRRGLVPGRPAADDPALAVRVWGRMFANPVGLAAGFDKDGEVPDAMLRLGFGFVEVGTVTPEPQPGNPRPRLFRLPADRAVINHFGFNSQGMEQVAANLRARLSAPTRAPGIVGANVGKNRDSADAAIDYAKGIEALAGLADYLVINVSSPNTPGLRDLQAKGALEALIERAKAARAEAAKMGEQAGPPDRPPLLLKIAPDLSQDELGEIAAVALATGIDGMIATNTTIERPPGLKSRHRHETGGLSGAPLFQRSTDVLATVYRLTKGRLPLIGVGGISSGRDAYAKIRSGATLVQLYTALVYQGPGLVARIKRELAACLRADGFASVAEAVGADWR
ncbi:MAG: quinone-dependent dihydroorotate dehydrogenase [Alphaproteobacteria bacterium]